MHCVLRLDLLGSTIRAVIYMVSATLFYLVLSLRSRRLVLPWLTAGAAYAVLVTDELSIAVARSVFVFACPG